MVGRAAARSDLIPEGGYRHLVVALDVSPSMKLRTPDRKENRAAAQRAQRCAHVTARPLATDQARISIVAFSMTRSASSGHVRHWKLVKTH